jgi:hypothetical protein
MNCGTPAELDAFGRVMTNHDPPNQRSAEEVELAKLQLERDKFDYEKSRSGRLTTTQLALLGSLLSVASGVIGAGVTGWFSKQNEEVKLKAGVGIEEIKGGTSINLERLKFETGLVIQAIKTDDQVKAVKTLKFFANAGLIPTFEKRVLALAQADDGVGVPALEGPRLDEGESYSSAKHGTLLASFVGYLTFHGLPFCNATFVDSKHFVVDAHCGLGGDKQLAELKVVVADVQAQMRGVGLIVNYESIVMDIKSIQNVNGENIDLGTLVGTHPKMQSSPVIRAPRPGEAIKIVYFSLAGSDRTLRIVTSQCAVKDIESSNLRKDEFLYNCWTPPGSSGAAIVSAADNSIVGMPESSTRAGDVGVKIDMKAVEQSMRSPRL